MTEKEFEKLLTKVAKEIGEEYFSENVLPLLTHQYKKGLGDSEKMVRVIANRKEK